MTKIMCNNNAGTIIQVNQSIMNSFSIRGKQDGARKLTVIKKYVSNTDT
jgi:hypothetical protein